MAIIDDMKTRNYLFKSILLLIAVFCTSATALGQRVSSPAKFTEDGAQELKLKAKSLVPMAPRPGDANCDAQVSIADVSVLIDMLLEGTAGYFSGADANQDGEVTIADVSVLIDMLLDGSANYSYDKALNDLNEIYRSMRTAGWSTTGNWHQCFVISAYNLMAEVMGDDMIMGAQGSGWFWFDATYNLKNRYTSSSWRSYDLWTAYYTWIANANYILEATQSMTGTSSELNYIKGQAYAIRAYSYFMLAQSFARTYSGHESDPCVPLFTGLAFNGSTGAPRSTVAQIYNQINADINQAVSLLNGTTQLVPDHIGYAVALGLKARIALVKEDWSTAYSAAVSAITASGKAIQDVDAFMGVNDAHAGNVMWGADIPTEEVGMYASFFSHMVTTKGYGARAPKMISLWLYDKMSSTDARLAWWRANDTGIGPNNGYVQQKFAIVDGTEWDGDYIWMRVEEMYLTAAEAACRSNQPTAAKNYLTQLMAKRDPNYSCTKTGTALGTLTTDETGSLLEEILIQRRIELWGEDGRIYTIRRLRQGFQRTEEDGWPADLQLASRSLQDPESYPWVLTIPYTEFMESDNMSINYDQNPLGDYPDGSGISTGEQNVSFSQAEYHINTAASSFEYTLTLTRSTTSGQYAVPINVTNSNVLRASTVVIFHDGENTAEVTVTGSYLELGRTYTCTLSLSPYDINNGSMSGRILSTNVEVKCENGNPAGQHISFGAASYQGICTNRYDCSVWVTLTRRVSQGDYRAVLSLETTADNINIGDGNALFRDGELTTQVEVYCYNISPMDTYSCVLKLSNADIATAIPGQPQITSTAITFKGLMAAEWEDAGTCTFTDYTWEESGYSASNVPVLKMEGTNTYCIYSPLAYAYPSNYAEGQGDTANWVFTLNDDGSISVDDGPSLNYWGYYAYWMNNYPQYCYITKDGNTYDVNFILEKDGSYYQGGHFVFTWER